MENKSDYFRNSQSKFLIDIIEDVENLLDEFDDFESNF